MVCQSPVLFSGTPVSEHFTVHKLADGVYALIHKIGGMAVGNSGLVDLGGHTLVFDTFLSLQAARDIPVLAKKLGLPPVQYVVNSHYHNDHVRGNPVFSDKVRIISTRRTAQLIEKKEPLEMEAEKKYAPKQLARYNRLLENYSGDKTAREYLNLKMWQGYFKALVEDKTRLATRIPDVVFDDEKIIRGSQRTAILMCLGGGHTESDLVLYLPEDQILFAGDLVFIQMHPYLADGSLPKLKKYLTRLQDLSVKTVVPGHGPVGDAGDIQVMKDYITMIETMVGKIIRDGSSIKGADAMEVPEPFRNWWFTDFFRSNLRFVLKKSTDDTADSRTSGLSP